MKRECAGCHVKQSGVKKYTLSRSLKVPFCPTCTGTLVAIREAIEHGVPPEMIQQNVHEISVLKPQTWIAVAAMALPQEEEE
jgi:hypothetical protein